MGQMEREIGFYTMVPGLFTYGCLLCLFICGPLLHPLGDSGVGVTTDEVIFYGFLFVFMYSVALGLIAAGNTALSLFKMRRAIPVSLLPFLVIVVWVIFKN
jgi:hypothetical protein